MSLVRRVISVEVPRRSSVVYENPCMCSNSACLSFLTKLTEAFAAKYCAVSEQARPTKPSPTSTAHRPTIVPLLSPPMPRSISAAITSGTNSSNVASISLNSGPSMLSFR